MESKFVQRDSGLKAVPRISNPSQLLELDLSGNLLILHLNALQSFTRLRKLVLSNTGLAALPLLPGSLESIEIAGNQMPGLPNSLRHCSALNYLDISHNQISSLSGLSRLRELRTLLASDNRISLLAGIEGLPALTTLVIDGNKVKDTEQISRLGESVQFLSLRNTPVLKFLSGKLPAHFIALQDGQLYGPKFQQEDSCRSVESQRTSHISVGCIDLRKVPEPTHSRSKTPDTYSMRVQAQPVGLQEVVEEFNLLKAENAVLEEKVSMLEKQLVGKDGDSFLLMEMVSELDIDVNEFSFSQNKSGQLLAVLQERERERKQLKAQNAMLMKRIGELEQVNVSQPCAEMLICDYESHLRETLEKLSHLASENQSLQDKVSRQSAKLQKFADFRERNRELTHSYKLEMAKNRELQDHLAKVYSDYSKLLKAGLCSALEANQQKEEKGKEQTVKAGKEQSPKAETVRRTDPQLINRLEQRLAKLHSKVQKLTVRPEEYFRKLQLCHEMLDARPIA